MTVLAKPNHNHLSSLQAVNSKRPQQDQPLSKMAPRSADHDSSLAFRKRPRRYQLHLWVSEREYALLKSLAESQDEPMSRIVRRLFGQLRPLVEREASCQFKSG